MKSSLSSSLLEGSLGLGLWLLLTPLAQLLKLLKLLTAAPSLLVPGQRLSSSSFLLEISFLPGKTLYLPKSLALQVTRTCLEHLPLVWKEGGRVAAGARGLGGCRVPPLLITPFPRQSSSAPRVTPYTPSQSERPAATPGWLHFASALQRGRCFASTGRVGWPGTAGYSASGPGGGDPDWRLCGQAHSPPIACGPRSEARLVGC